MGEDLLLAAEQLTARGATVRAVVLRGAGTHFSAGGNPYAHKGGAPLASAAATLCRTFAGFAALRGPRDGDTMGAKEDLAYLLSKCDEAVPDAAARREARALLEAEVVPHRVETDGPRVAGTLSAQMTLAALLARDGERARAGALFAACAAGYAALYGAEDIDTTSCKRDAAACATERA